MDHPRERSPVNLANRDQEIIVVADEEDNKSGCFVQKANDPREEQEPLGYQHFLYDVNIEYSPGGNRSHSVSNSHSFKLKYLPYMVRKEDCRKQFRKNSSISSSNSSICDQQQPHNEGFIFSSDAPHIDVTKATCAFLGNSDYVPNEKFKRRRVVLELISAKLSQTTSFNVSANSSYTGLVTLAERSPIMPDIGLNDSELSYRHQSTRDNNNSSMNSTLGHQRNIHFSSNAATSTSPMSSKRFVNYTILIKIAPGLDKHPAVIERRFSDFLSLYQGLKSNELFAEMVDKHITFPKKVYMGNFSLTNIAERSIEFSRLLSLCITNVDLLWSTPFISFLIDKELKEAHKMSLCGDPDDVQATIETAYYIQRKLYLNCTHVHYNDFRSYSSSEENSMSYGHSTDRYSPILPNGNQSIVNSPSSETISIENSNSYDANLPSSADINSSPNQSVYETSEDFSSLTLFKKNSTPLNQRILVTFCMLFLTYYRGKNYQELRAVVQEFTCLISSQSYMNSLVRSRHYITLRACLLFLLNINDSTVIDEQRRLELKRKLEDIDGAHAGLDESLGLSTQSTVYNDHDSYSNSPRTSKKRNGISDSVHSSTSIHRITKRDLTSLLRDRNFCTFQDGDYVK